MKTPKGPVTKHHQLATTGHAEGLCVGGRPMKSGGSVRTVEHDVHVHHKAGERVKHKINVHHHHSKG